MPAYLPCVLYASYVQAGMMYASSSHGYLHFYMVLKVLRDKS